MIFEQFLDHDLGCASYLVGDERSGEAVVVDPPFAIERILATVERRGARLVRVLETHTHADHVSGHGRLALELGLPISIHPSAEVSFESEPLEDGAETELGDVVLRCVHTPGHRPEHVALTVTERSRGDGPTLVLTGDSLFVGDAARPDLAVGAREGAEGLYHSLQRLLQLPDAIGVYPGHVAGSLCGRSMSPEPSSTIGAERSSNPMLLLDGLDDFLSESASVAAPMPPNLNRIVELNRGPFVPAPPALEELPVPPGGTQLLDVRAPQDFLGGHQRGAVNVPVSGTSFATRAAFVLDAERPVAILAATEDEAGRAARGLNAVGFLDLPGFVLGGGEVTAEAVSVDELESLLAAGVALIDVREKEERDDGYIAGSRNIPFRLLRLCTDLPEGRPVSKS